MPSVAVFTVKHLIFYESTYWTYGGFGDYVKAILPHFDRVILACHPRIASAVPAGWYQLSDPKLEIEWLPFYEREDQCLRSLPKMFVQCRAIAKRADVINARVPDYTGICGGLWAKWYGKPLFINHVDDWHTRVRKPSTRLRGLMKRGLQIHYAMYAFWERVLCRDELLFAQGEFASSLYRDNALMHQCVSSSHYDADVLPRPSAGKRMTGNELRILTVGRHVFVKGHRDLIAAVAIVKRRIPGLKLHLSIVGEGPMTDDYRELAESLGIAGSVAFPGQVDRVGIFGLYDQADLFCLPSLSEGTPKVILEAMARGTPVIATAVGGVPSVVRHNETGILVPPSDPEGLANAIEKMWLDRHLASHCIEKGIEVARAHTVEKEWGQMMSIVRATYPKLWCPPGD